MIFSDAGVVASMTLLKKHQQKQGMFEQTSPNSFVIFRIIFFVFFYPIKLSVSKVEHIMCGSRI